MESAAALKDARTRAGISLREMARRLDKSASYLSQFEAGKTPGHLLKLEYAAELSKAKKGGK